MQNILADEFMEEVYRQVKDDGGNMVKLCKLFDQDEINIVIGRLEIALAISEHQLDLRAEDIRDMITTLKSARQAHVGQRPSKRSIAS